LKNHTNFNTITVPRMIPAKSGINPVAVKYKIPIEFKLK